MASPKSRSAPNPRARRAAYYRMGLLMIPPFLVSLVVYGLSNPSVLLITVVAAAASILFDVVRHKSRFVPFPVYLLAVWALQICVLVFLSRAGGSVNVPGLGAVAVAGGPAPVGDFAIMIETTLDENGHHAPVDISVFPTDIKTMSVVLAAHNEQKYMERTCQSIFDETPPHILKEIIVVDDASEPPLRNYLEKFPEVKVIRHVTRQGLIRSKTDGAMAATGDLVVFLDAHVKPEKDWALPLLRHTNINYKRVVVPVIPILNGDDWQVHDKSAGTKMMFDWGLGFNWFEDGNDLVPIMSGGLLAITKKWWHESGEYDNGMLMWGGENIEQSIRVWLCGGEIFVARDSRVSHVFRPSFPYKIDNTQVYLNKIRTVEVWFDEYKDYFYNADPYAKTLRERAISGDIQERFQFRKDMKCKPFQHFVDKFKKVFDSKGMLPSDAYMIKDETSGLCLSSGGADRDLTSLQTCDEKNDHQRWNDNPGKTTRNRLSDKCFDANAGVPNKEGTDLMTYFCMINNHNQEFSVANGQIRWEKFCARADGVVGARLKLHECPAGFMSGSGVNKFVKTDWKKLEGKKGAP